MQKRVTVFFDIVFQQKKSQTHIQKRFFDHLQKGWGLFYWMALLLSGIKNLAPHGGFPIQSKQ